MIPEYKMYHGSVLAEIIDSYKKVVSFTATADSGRLLNYVLNDQIGLQLKYATQRLRPWHFTFPAEHLRALELLNVTKKTAFLVLVCGTDGIIAVDANEILKTIQGSEGEQFWLRADRRNRHMYRLFGPGGEFTGKFRTTVQPIVDALRQLDRENT